MDLTDMFYSGQIQSVCYKCKAQNLISADVEEFNCSDCGALQMSPQFNDYEYEKTRPIQ
jgi:ribosomal protein L40E